MEFRPRPAAEQRQQMWIILGGLGFCLALLAYISSWNYLLFHSLAEIFNIAVCWGVFFIVWNSLQLDENRFLNLLGSAYLFVGLLYLLHTLAYKGMGVFTDDGGNLATQLWVAARFLHALAHLLTAIIFVRNYRPRLLLPTCGWALLAALLLLLVFTGNFPICFIPGEGLTLFKKVSEITTVVMFGGSALLVLSGRQRLAPLVLKNLLSALLFAMATGLMFIFYVDVYGLSNLLGHLCNIVSIYCIYRTMVYTGLSMPHHLLFHELQAGHEALRTANRKLEEKVLLRTRELDERNLELERINRSLSDFAYSISHDLREPLRGIYSFSQLLDMDYRDQLDERGRKMTATIMRLTKRLDTRIMAILKYSRISRSEMTADPVELEPLLDEVLDNLSEFTKDAHIERPCRLPAVRGKADMLQAVFQNLISNGIIYNTSADKRITIGCNAPSEVASPQTEGRVAARKRKHTVFWVKDNGIGIQPRSYENIFGMFRRLHNTGEFGDGAGVGLAITKQIIKRHGGKIWLESATQEGAESEGCESGTTFFFTLPTADEVTNEQAER